MHVAARQRVPELDAVLLLCTYIGSHPCGRCAVFLPVCCLSLKNTSLQREEWDRVAKGTSLLSRACTEYVVCCARTPLLGCFFAEPNRVNSTRIIFCNKTVEICRSCFIFVVGAESKIEGIPYHVRSVGVSGQERLCSGAIVMECLVQT